MKKNLRYGRSVMRTIFSATLLYTAAVGAAQASTIALQEFSGGTDSPAYDNTNMTIGWAFTPTSNISVTNLGFWDQTPNTRLTTAHDVGLWAIGGTLLASATIKTDSTLVDSFRYEAITAVNLIAGASYLIGASIDPYAIDYIRVGASSITVASEITFNTAARSAASTGFAAPTILSPPATKGRFGPNFQFTTTASADPDPSAAPEPFSLGLVGIGVACLAAHRRRRSA